VSLNLTLEEKVKFRRNSRVEGIISRAALENSFLHGYDILGKKNMSYFSKVKFKGRLASWIQVD
jgi:hypothetical protein